MDDLQEVMGGSLGGLVDAIVDHIPGGELATTIIKEVPGAIVEVRDWYQETFPSDAHIAESQATAQAAAESASHASYQAEMNAHYGDRTVSNGYY